MTDVTKLSNEELIAEAKSSDFEGGWEEVVARQHAIGRELASRLEAALAATKAARERERKLKDDLAWYQLEAVTRTTTGLRHGRAERLTGQEKKV